MGGIENMKEINFCEAYKQRKENHIAKSSFVGVSRKLCKFF